MNVLVDDYGRRVRVYRPMINREESSLNVSLFVPESSVNVGLYDHEQVNHLNGNSEAGTFQQQAQGANYWWGMVPYNQPRPQQDLYTIQPGVYSSPANFQISNYTTPSHRTMSKVYGAKPVVGHRSRISASYGGQ